MRDVPISSTHRGQIAEALAHLEKIVVEGLRHGGEFLPASTQQLAEVLYKKLNLPVLKRGKTGPSTDQEVLEEFKTALRDHGLIR